MVDVEIVKVRDCCTVPVIAIVSSVTIYVLIRPVSPKLPAILIVYAPGVAGFVI